VRDWLLERILVDEVPPALRAEATGARASAVVRRRLHELRASNERILAELPPADVAAEVARRLRVARLERERRRMRTARRIALIGPAVAAAAALLFFFLQGGSAGLDGGVRAKGDPRLELYRQRGSSAERLRPGALVGAGDHLQISYVAAGRKFGAIVSIDGRGAVTLHYPEHTGEAGALAQSGAVALPFAYELDDAPAFERFFFVTADRPFDVAVVTLAAQQLAADPRRAPTAPLALPPGLAQLAYTFRKGPSR